MSIVLDGTTGITAPDVDSKVNGLNYPDASSMGFRNRIINGGMVIDQRNNGASVTSAANATYFLDRWRSVQNTNSKFSIQQNAGAVIPPAGFTNYLGATSLSAYSVPAGETAGFGQRIEGFNVADLAWGTANAQSVTLSFRVYSSLTGTFAGSIQNGAQTRSYPFTFTVASANTWTTVSLTIPGDTTGTWLTNNGTGITLWFSLGSGADWQATANVWGAGEKYGVSGQVNVIATNGATFYITGVQLEAGSVATPFERRDYGRELIMCQRYFQRLNGTIYTNWVASGTTGYVMWHFKTEMRTAPTVTIAAGSEANFNSSATDNMLAWSAASRYPFINTGSTASAEL